ncbi:unnamed protein product [Kluyveromyces dobzhanskii CBS 2104]|uniref:WGS project CCBQ000000000 data, contig 00102 n=1 Tax=Kluyveromyces dobzhanskii CBS 2104 TaxID=1427455 RepID=A0A0A8L712_9SACH|nr:unnamed protein product [Kluyveromyces dobzhanskii CBS 2104]
MDYKEEQSQEIEILESIYPDELTVLNSDYPNIEIQVDIKLEPVPLADSSYTADSITNHHILHATFTFPENYPDEAPVIKVVPEEVPKLDKDDEEDDEEEDGEDEVEYDDHGNPVVSRFENLPDKIHFHEFVPQCVEKLNGQIEEDMLLGMQMCFGLISNIKEYAEEWFQEQLSELERQHDILLQEREKEEQKKFRGTEVTRETYLEWRSRFRKELGLDVRDADRRLAAHQGRLSGRQIFEQGLAGDEDLDEDDETLITEGVKTMAV